MNSLIKWPGGKSGEIKNIEHLIPKYNRYIEPFFGGGALFFHLRPRQASINDISNSLMEYYSLLKSQDKNLKELLLCYNNSFNNILSVCNKHYLDIFTLYDMFQKEKISDSELDDDLLKLTSNFADEINSGFSEKLMLNEAEFQDFIIKMVSDKIQRTVVNEKEAHFSDEDLKNNLITGFTSGYYMYFRKIFNDLNLNRIKSPSIQYKVANFYFIREYCYGSMFRYNKNGEFNIPYGGMSYNNKNFKSKIDSMFNDDVKNIFENTDIHCDDFETFLKKTNMSSNDFMFLDPPYDTDFSDYEGKDFTKFDQERLANSLKRTLAKFILIIKNTDFINGLYEKDFKILSFDKQYAYNVRSRNDRDAEHLIITNLSV